ncbi:hypothetical protein ACFTS5_11005 [Nocardia sp. NPDC056952]|uniref:hypothetical protein n=1 Tax=Nocardia sp. NPDC056952 TaxID=3345979 RepID=UPI003628724F
MRKAAHEVTLSWHRIDVHRFMTVRCPAADHDLEVLVDPDASIAKTGSNLHPGFGIGSDRGIAPSPVRAQPPVEHEFMIARVRPAASAATLLCTRTNRTRESSPFEIVS